METLMQIWDYISKPVIWVSLGEMFLKIVIIIILGMILNKIGGGIIERAFLNRKHLRVHMSNRREQTLSKLLKNVLIYLITFIVIVMILETFGVPVSTLLAGAGVAGLAIGFGAQSLVKDIISGFFIIFEDQFSVGDYITVDGVEGTVEEIGFRTTKLAGWTGEQYVLPNGSINLVTNYSIHNGLSVVEINVPYENDIPHVELLLEEIINTLPDKYDVFISPPEIHGVTNLELSNFVIRVIAETSPGSQWAGERIIRKEVKEQLFNHGIEIPSPRIVVYSRQNEQEENHLRKGVE